LALKEAEVKAKDILVGARADAEREVRERRKELTALETKIESREETLRKNVSRHLSAAKPTSIGATKASALAKKNITDKEAQHRR